MQPPQPSARPRSWQSVRTYVPFEQRTRIGPVRALALQQLQRMDGDASRPARDLLSSAGQLIELLAVYLDGGVHGRDLLDGAEELPQSGLQLRTGDADGIRLQYGPARVLRVGHDAETQPRDVFLFRGLEKFSRAGGAADKNRKHAGGHRVERAAMADAAFMKHAAQLGRHVLARPAGALVDHKDAVCHRVSFLQSDAAFRERAQNRRLRPRDAARDAGPGRRGMAAAAQALADG